MTNARHFSATSVDKIDVADRRAVAASRHGRWVRVFVEGKCRARFLCSDQTLTHVAVHFYRDPNRRESNPAEPYTLQSVELVGDWQIPADAKARAGYGGAWWSRHGSVRIVVPVLLKGETVCPHTHSVWHLSPLTGCTDYAATQLPRGAF